MQTWISGWLVVALSATAAADPATSASAAPTTPATDASDHFVYVELLGKGGAYGLGYERRITDRLALGVVASVLPLRDQQLWTASPYLHATIGTRGKHAWFGELGGVLVHSRIASPVSDWDGMTDTGAGGVATLGYERTGRHVTFRTYGAAMVGEGGIAPWLGFAIGMRP